MLCAGQPPGGSAPEAWLALWVARPTGPRSWRGGWEAGRRRELWTLEVQENISWATKEVANPSAPPRGPPVDRFLLVAFRASSQVRRKQSQSWISYLCEKGNKYLFFVGGFWSSPKQRSVRRGNLENFTNFMLNTPLHPELCPREEATLSAYNRLFLFLTLFCSWPSHFSANCSQSFSLSTS